MNRIPSHEFVHIAREIPEGQKRKVDHCGDAPCMYVSNEPAGYRAYCFRCHGTGFDKKVRDLSQILASLKKAGDADAEAARSLALPSDCKPITEGWPVWGRVWLHKAGLSSDDIERLGFLYSPSMDRVVLPVRDRRGQIVFWQARGNNRTPKYLSPDGVDRHKVIPMYGQESKVVVLTEDILSAAKVGLVNEAWSLMGTLMHNAVLLEIMRRKLQVIVALDPDEAGLAGATRTTAKLRAYDIPVTNVTRMLPADPKLMPRSAIANLVKEVLNEPR